MSARAPHLLVAHIQFLVNGMLSVFAGLVIAAWIVVVRGVFAARAHTCGT